ncbi:MAG TPA: hypothetical protein VF748_17415 [Candidatus Acidoferrum sp.]
MPKLSANGSEKFLRLLEKGVREVMNDKAADREHKLAAINAGAKLLAIRHKIEGHDTSSFFS